MTILGKQIQRGELHTIQDFAERLTLRFNNEIQTEHFGGSCTVSLEGVAVRFFPGEASVHAPVMEFFTFLSDSKVQDSSVVNYNMDKLIHYLKAQGVVMKAGDLFLTNSDGCAAQYRCSTAFFFLSSLAIRHDIQIDRSIS